MPRSRHHRPDESILSSWKEIAGYLAVSTRTAQTWEKNHGLPVHRLPGGPKAGAYAYKTEIDAWRSRAPSTEVEPATSPEASPPLSPAPPRARLRVRSKIAFLVVAAVTTVAILAGLSLFRARPSLDPATAEMKGKVLVVMNKRGEVLWSRAFPRADRALYADRTFFQPIIVEDLDGDGHTEVIFNYRPEPPHIPRESKLICFDVGGRVRWEFVYGRAKTWEKTRKLAPLYGGSIVRLLRDGNRTWIVTVAIQIPYFPCQVAFLDPKNGRPSWEYWHPGHLSACLLQDLDGDTQDEIVLAGTNNPGPGIGHAALVVLKRPSARTVPFPREWQSPGWWGGNEYKYVLFPRSDLAAEIKGGTSAIDLFIAAPGEIGVGLAGGFEQEKHICWTGIYKLDFKLNALSFRPHDCFVSTHELFERRGKLDHKLSQADLDQLTRVAHFSNTPNGNDPSLARLFASPPPTPDKFVARR